MGQKRELLRLMGDLLEYPRPGVVDKARYCAGLLEPARPEACRFLSEFASFAESQKASSLEELYTVTFDLSPQCYPYAGYQLFGEDPKRSELMLGLQHGYQLTGFDAGADLPDYVPTLLRFLATLRDDEAESELTSLVLVPALEKMAGALESKENPYSKLVSATLSVLGGDPV